jgi:hypothetical protein
LLQETRTLSSNNATYTGFVACKYYNIFKYLTSKKVTSAEIAQKAHPCSRSGDLEMTNEGFSYSNGGEDDLCYPGKGVHLPNL